MSSEDTGADISQQSAESVQAPQEQMVPQSKVNELIANAKLVSAEKARREAEARIAQMQQGQSQQPQQNVEGAQQQASTQPGIDSQLAKLVEAKIAEKEQAIYHQQQREMLEGLAENYDTKMAQGEHLYPDFKEVTGKFNPVKFPEIVVMAAQMDNTADVMYDLLANPMKLSHIKQLAMFDENLAFSEMQKLSASIKRNEDAANNNQKSPSPLSKPKASIAGADSGRKTIADWKRIYKA